ncbi:putative cytochrome P450 hydroxylase [Euzebya pacifica]|uniref:Putative cytochrome P450 hydroxylase n=1 Tax=Euzebya pacifica TaxID=1608957 RepID=A0A346XWR1_9ACTN|nr:putative cytochrome P450 hydroxylase [Euzebya pacifica]
MYHQMRERHPVVWSEELQTWLVTSHELVREVYRDHEAFGTVGTTAGSSMDALSADVRAQVPTLVAVEEAEVLNVAPPEVHATHRALVSRPLSVRRLEERRDWVEQMCAAATDRVVGRTSIDVVADYATPVAYEAILEIFGSPREHLPVYQRTSDAFFTFISHGGGTREHALAYDAALQAFRDALEDVYADQRQRAGDDTLIASLLEEVGSDGGFGDFELFVLLRKFFSAGHENLIHTVAVAVMELLRSPDQLAEVRDSPNLAADAYAEAVRFEAPNQGNARIVTRDMDFHGCHLRAGDRVMNIKAAADRDPVVWTEPDKFDLHRDQHEPDGGSVAFGQGIHFCVGAGLARLVGPTAINALLRALPDLELPEDFEPNWQQVPLRRKLADLKLPAA